MAQATELVSSSIMLLYALLLLKCPVVNYSEADGCLHSSVIWKEYFFGRNGLVWGLKIQSWGGKNCLFYRLQNSPGKRLLVNNLPDTLKKMPPCPHVLVLIYTHSSRVKGPLPEQDFCSYFVLWKDYHSLPLIFSIPQSTASLNFIGLMKKLL